MATIAPFTPVPIYDSFSRAEDTVADHERWGVMDSGTAWRNTKPTYFNTNFDMSDISNPIGEGTIDVAAHLEYGTAWISLDSAGIPAMTTSGEILANMKWTCASSVANPSTDFGLVLNRNSDNSFYYCAIHDSTGEVSIGVYADGSRHELDRRSKSTKKNTKYWIRFQRDSGKIYLKIWDATLIEPGGWTLGAEEYTGTHKPGSGTPGIFFAGTSVDYQVIVESVYYYTKDATFDAQPPKPVIDSFARSVNRGWGQSDTTHKWQGHLGDDPRAPTTVGYVSGGNGAIRFLNTGNYWGFIGPVTTSAIETTATFQMNTASTTNKVYLYVGLHGSYQYLDGVLDGTGYAAQVTSGGNKLGIYKKTSFAGSWTLISEVTLGFSLLANTDYKIKFQKTGTTLRAVIWLRSGSMPAIWDVTTTDASITAGGQLFVQFTQDTAATRTIFFDDIAYGPLTPLTGGTPITVQTTTGALNLSSADATITYTANYTNDTNNNNTALIQYKKASDTTWTTVTSPAPNTGTSPKKYEDTITGLKSFTDYQVRVTFNDTDDVAGINPVVSTITTSALRSQLQRLTVSNIATSSADFVATYLYDTNNNATAGLQKRAFGAFSEFFKHDFYVGAGGTDLAGLVGSNSADTFSVHPQTDSNSYIYANAGRAYMRTTLPDGNGGHRAIYKANFTGQSQMTLSSKVLIPTYATTRLGYYVRLHVTQNTGYQVGLTWSSVGNVRIYINKWEDFEITDGVISDDIPIELDTFYDFEFRMADVSGDNLKIAYFNNIEVLKWNDNELTSPHSVGIFFESNIQEPLNYGTSAVMYDFVVDGRPSIGSWGSSTAMTAYAAGAGPYPENTHRYFFWNDTGLTPDTFYEYKVTIADSDGTSGDSSDTTTFLTHGNEAYLIAGESLGVTTYPTSAVIRTTYNGDSDDDSSLSVQYRLASDRIWTTAPTNFTTVNRGTKLYRTVLSGLRASSTYEVKVVLSDPDGIEPHQTDTDFVTFTTETIIKEHDQPLKNYQWKIYDNVSGKYLETWEDAGSPKFSFEENSGVSDLTARLPRAVSVLNDPHSSIQHHNIVDVWVHDIFEQGLGPNLLEDEDFTLGKWTWVADPAVVFYHATQGVIGDRCIKIVEPGSDLHEVFSEAIYVDPLTGVLNNVPDTYKNRLDFRSRTFICSIYAKTLSDAGGRLVLGVYEYGEDGSGDANQIAFSQEIGETVGNEWQKLQISFRVTDPNTRYIRVVARNDGAGTYWIDKGKVTCKEQLLYSGHIETITSNIDDKGEYIEVEIYGEASVLSDDYIEFLQFAETPQERDRVYDIDGTPLLDSLGEELRKERFEPTDPSNMLKYTIDIAQRQNPKCRLYYTEDSIHNTGITDGQYTFRQRKLRDIFDQIRDLCPSGWHYIVMPDGLVILRGPEHVRTHVLRVGVEVIAFKQVHTIKDLKNVLYFKGRQDSDFSETDGFGSIKAEIDDPKSIKQYGRRVLFQQDASIVDPRTANTYIEGRLTEANQPENQITTVVIDEKAILDNNLGFRGYNIESILPGDYVILLNPKATPNKVYWDQADWDIDVWDYTSASALIPTSVPIKAITYDDNQVSLSLSQRPPSFTSDFQRLARKSQQNDSEK